MDHITIEIAFWDDPVFLSLKDKRRVAYIFLRANRVIMKSMSGIYQMSLSELESKLNTRRIDALEIMNLLPGIEYDQERSIVFVRERFRTMKEIVRGIQQEIEAENAQIATYLWRSFVNEYPETATHLNLYYNIPMPACQRTWPRTWPTLSGQVGHKMAYASNVYVSQEQYDGLVCSHGQDKAARIIQRLNAFKVGQGKEYEDDMQAIKNWVIKAVEDDIVKDELAGGVKERCGHYVWLRKSEYEYLVREYGEDQTKRLVEELDRNKVQKSWGVGNDYKAIQNWVNKKKDRESSAGAGSQSTAHEREVAST